MIVEAEKLLTAKTWLYCCLTFLSTSQQRDYTLISTNSAILACHSFGPDSCTALP